MGDSADMEVCQVDCTDLAITTSHQHNTPWINLVVALTTIDGRTARQVRCHLILSAANKLPL